MRQLATVQQVLKIDPIAGADKIEVATILGWHVVVKKDEFKVGDKVVYIEIDSRLPETNPHFEFMWERHFKVKTIKHRKQISQGIAFGMYILPSDDYAVGADVTDLLGITKYEPYEEPIRVPAAYVKNMWPRWLPKWVVCKFKRYNWFTRLFLINPGKWPKFLRKTDETRVQNCQCSLNVHAGEKFVYSEKVDGSSCTCYYYKGHFGVCSRNLELKNNGNNFWATAEKLGIPDKLKAYGKNIAIQGELIGPGIQGNKYKRDDFELHVFSVYNIDTGEYLPYGEFRDVCGTLELTTVPILDTEYALDTDIDTIVKLSEGQSKLAKVPREGIVIRKIDNSHISFKAINPNFLLKFDE